MNSPWRNIALTALTLFLVIPALSFGQNVKVGEPAPDFAVPSLDGEKTIRLSDFRGRRVLIFTWASW
jgi:peroxiredoxin